MPLHIERLRHVTVDAFAAVGRDGGRSALRERHEINALRVEIQRVNFVKAVFD